MLVTLIGPNLIAKKARFAQLTEQNETMVFDGESLIRDVVASLGQSDLFGSSPTIVINNPLEFKAADQELLASHLSQHQQTAQPLIISLDQDSFPAKGELSKILQQGQVEKFEALTVSGLLRWTKQQCEQLNIEVESAALGPFIARLGNNQVAIASELQSLRWQEPAKLTLETIQTTLPLGGELDVFALTDAWAGKKLEASLQQLQQLSQQQLPPGMIISMLERQARLIYVCAQSNSQTTIAKTLGMPPFAVAKAAKALRLWSSGQIAHSIQELYALDKAIKTSQIEPQFGLERWLIRSLS